jgi:hypothetical protein
MRMNMLLYGVLHRSPVSFASVCNSHILIQKFCVHLQNGYTISREDAGRWLAENLVLKMDAKFLNKNVTVTY